MTVRSFDGKIPRIGEGSYVHPSAGALGKASWTWPGAIQTNCRIWNRKLFQKSYAVEWKGDEQDARF